MKKTTPEQEVDIKKIPILSRIKFRLKTKTEEVITTLYINGIVTTTLAIFGMYYKEQWLLTTIAIIIGLTIGNTITYIAKMKQIKKEAEEIGR